MVNGSTPRALGFAWRGIDYTFSSASMELTIPLAARVLPTILSGLTTGLLSVVINKAISDSVAASGDELYLHKHDKCYRVQKCKGNGLYLALHPRFVVVDDCS